MKSGSQDQRDLFETVKRFGQEHVFRWWDELDESEREALLVQIRRQRRLQGGKGQLVYAEGPIERVSLHLVEVCRSSDEDPSLRPPQ